MGTKARVLVACMIGGMLLKPDQVIDLPSDLAKRHAKNGEIDPTKAAVDYCLNELGASIVLYEIPVSPEQLQLQAEIESLEGKLAEAPEADQPALQAALDEKKAALAALA